MNRREALVLLSFGTGAAVNSLSVNPIAALEACAPSQTSNMDRGSAGTNCEREVRIAYLAGAYKTGEPIIASLTNRTVDVVIEQVSPIKLRVGSNNNSGVAFEDSAAAYRRAITIGGLTLNYIAVPVGDKDIVTVGIHRLNIDGSRRNDEASNPPYQSVDTCLVRGGPDMNTLVGLRTIQVFSQNSRLGDGPGDYRNSNSDLVFQDPRMLFQGVELGYLLER